MPQKKEKKKVIKKVIKNTKPKPKPSLKDSINVKVGLQDMLKLTCAGCAEDKKKKPRRKKRQAQTKEITDNNVSYVDSSGQPISNEIINNRSFSRSYIPQPFSRNSSIVGTSFNETSIMDKVIEKMSKLNNSNQSMNKSVLNQSTTAPIPAPPQVPRQTQRQSLSTIASVSPSIAPQTLNFDFSSPVRPFGLGLLPMSTSSMAASRVNQFAVSTLNTAKRAQEEIDQEEIKQKEIDRIFMNIQDPNEQKAIQEASTAVKKKHKDEIAALPTGAPQSQRFTTKFKEEYKGKMYPGDAAIIGWQFYRTLR